MGESISDEHVFTKQFIRRWCPNVAVDDVDWTTASKPTDQYNCFGFALGDLRWWEPPDDIAFNTADYWPDTVPAGRTVEAYVAAAEQRGFRLAADGAWEERTDTIVLYFTLPDRSFKHAARQKSPGVWESKIGALSDIEHPPAGLDNIQYGDGRLFMKRRLP